MLRSYIWLIVCVTLWGSNFVFGSILVQEFSPVPLAAIRLVFSSLFLLLYALYTRKFTTLTSWQWKMLLALGLVGTLMNQTAFFNGLQTTDATTASLILSLAPIVTGILAAVFLKERFTMKMLLGSLIALIGVSFVVGAKNLSFSGGEALIFVAMFTFSASIILMRKLTERLNSFITTVYSTIMGTVLLAPVALWESPRAHVSHHWWAWLLLIGTAIVMQGICGLIWNRELQHVGAGNAAMFLNLQPFVTMLIGFLLLGTTVTLPQVIGAGFIISGVALSQWKWQRKPVNVKISA